MILYGLALVLDVNLPHCAISQGGSTVLMAHGHGLDSHGREGQVPVAMAMAVTKLHKQMSI